MDFSNREQVENKLKELKNKNLPKMNIEGFSKLDARFAQTITKASDEEKQVINNYLSKYFDYTVSNDNRCLFNEKHPSLSWGLAHGVAQDLNTGLSWVMYHYFIINGEEMRYEHALQYHPDCYDIDEDEVETNDAY